MTTRRIAFAIGVLIATFVAVGIHAGASEGGHFPSIASSTRASFDCIDKPCDAAARGAVTFLDRKLKGMGTNGRACADCHMPNDHFQLSPQDVEERFQSVQQRRQASPNADDPLFRPVDADDFRTNGEQAHDYRNLRENGLIRIAFPLPPNIRLIDPVTDQPSAESIVDVWRSVPSIENVALSGPGTTNPWFRGPNEFGGYQLDARVRTLQEQALGAFTNHAQAQQPPTERMLDDLAAFQGSLFTSPGVRDLEEGLRHGTTPLPDPDPILSPLEQQGKIVFIRACTQCHGGPDQTTAQPPVPHFQDIRTQCPRPVDTVSPPRFVFAACPERLAANARTYEVSLPNGVTTRRTSSDPGRALLTGFVGGPAPTDDWNKLDVPQLRGISHTAPYFHNNSAASLDDVVDHYVTFFTMLRVTTPAGAPPPPPTTTDGVHFDRAPLPAERKALLAYLHIL